MNNNIQCSIESSTTKIELNSAVDGVFLVPELEGLVGLPEIRTTSGVNAGYDGGWTSAQHYDARLISIRGVIASPDISKVEDKRRAIASLLGQGRKEQLTLRFTTEAGNAYAISVRTISCEMALQRVLTTQEFLIQLRADDPLIYDDGAAGGIAAILQPQRALGGFEINFELPLAIGGGAEDTVVDNGNETVYPVIKLYGALHSPTVVNRTTNQQMQILADLQYSIDWHTYRSATGDYILVNDGLNGAPMTLSQLLGNATQTTYEGKNLFSGDYAQFDNQGGTGSTYDYFKLPTSDAYYFSLKAKNAITPSNHYIGFNYEGGTAQVRYKWIYQNASATAGQVFKGENFDANDRLQYMFMYPKGQETLDWFKQNFELIQLEKGTQGTDYEEYCGGIPSPNPDYPQDIHVVTGDSTVKIEGKNQQPTSWAQDFVNAVNLPNIASIETFDGKNCLKYQPSAGYGSYPTKNFTLGVGFKENTQYTISFDEYSAASNRHVAFYYTDGTYSTYTATPANTWTRVTMTSTAGKTVAYVAPYYTSGTTYIDIGTIQLELGSTATAYEPYQGQSYTVDLNTIELAKIGNYQDRIYKDDGKWYIEKQVGKVVFDGTESTWGIFGNNNAFYSGAYDVQTPSSTTTAGAIMANYYTADSESNIYNARVDYGIGVSGERRILVRNKDITTVADFRAWLASNKPTVYYALATPITTEITDETLLYQLNFLASLYEGVNNISLVGTGAQGEMVIRYATDYTVNQDIITIDSQARTITLNGQDIYHLKTSESEFLVLAPGENKLYLTSEVSDDSGYAEVKFKQGYLSI